MYLLVDIGKTVALQVVVGFQRAAEVLAFYFTMPFTSEKRQCIRSPLFGQDVWLTKKLAESSIL